MSEYPHDERNDFAAYAPSETLGDNFEDDMEALHDDELDDLSLADGDEPDTDPDAWEDGLEAVNGSGGKCNGHRTTDARRAIERHRERKALRDMLADGYADSWDQFEPSGTGH